MYKVLLVDDERMILEGIAKIVDWEKHEVELIDKAMNGLEALECIANNCPDIVITDITMPGLDGIGLVSKAKEEYPDIKWIFLSGYSEFEYAQKAIRFGVKHYLLKPCNEEKIAEALDEVVTEKKKEDEAIKYLQSMQDEALKLYHYEYEDILKKYLNYQELPNELIKQLKVMLEKKFNDHLICFIVLCLDDENEYILLQKLLEKYSNTNNNEHICTIVDDSVVIMEKYTPTIEDRLTRYLQHLPDQSNQNITAIISPTFTKDEIFNSSFRLENAIAQSFYVSSSKVIRSQDWITFLNTDKNDIEIDLDKIIIDLKKSELKRANQIIQEFCQKLQDYYIHPKIAKSYFIKIYILILSKYNSNIEENRIGSITKMENFLHIQHVQQFFHDLFDALLQNDQNSKHYSKVVRQMLDCIEKEIENPNLSLRWIGNNCLYMNPDYLGKIFKKEVGQRFSSYVTNLRINKAVKIIETEEEVRVFELAERMGFGNNPHYFSQLFKRIKGYTPSEVIKSHD
ncbi:two-component system, response regulator YesN [Gracilibacillus orientalis]|uniref:Two-component system, response regulator YesN n=1 Tax=Gracilibacillus orientalis TaxID=334253 RepID=A0A1I4P116_9BACI|nr:response regulator [Gracilibacillus orientalis]SFM21217.1 two-component system, response regulator YesN [Gracilibacillus orientalis]